MELDLSVEFMGLTFKNPIWLGASDATNKWNVDKAIDSGVGAIVLKSVSDLTDFQQSGITRFLVHDEEGNTNISRNYTFFSRGGPLQPLDEVLEKLPQWKKHAETMNVRLIGSVNAGTVEGWADISSKLAESGVDALELNFGNPHARHSDNVMGAKISQSAQIAEEIVRVVARATNLPILIKLSPHAPDFVGLAGTLYRAGAAGITTMHRFQGLMLDIETQAPLLNGYNGVSGPWMVPLTLYWVSQIYNNIGCPVVGGNGVSSWRSAVEFILAGANSVQLSSSIIVNGYGLVEDILSGLQHYCENKGISTVSELVGRAADQLLSEESVQFPTRTVKVDNSGTCINCENKPCQNSCFFGALSLKDGIPNITDHCNGCGMCTIHCPFAGALKFVE